MGDQGGLPGTHFESALPVDLGSIVMNLEPLGMPCLHLFESGEQSGAPAQPQKSQNETKRVMGLPLKGS